MKLRIMFWTAATLVAGSALVVPSRGRAIPAFARKYHTTCARCHSVVPRLNNYGWNFKLRGFHVPGDEDVGKISMPEDKRLTLLDQVPFAVRLLGNIQSSTATQARPASTLDSEIDFLMAGSLAKRNGFWAEVDTGKNSDGSYSVNIGNMRSIFIDLLKRSPTALNVEVGKFNMDEFGISTGRIMTQNPYSIYDVGSALSNFAESEEVQGFTVFGAIGTGIGQGVAQAEQKAGKAGTVTEEEKKALARELNEQAAKPPPDTPEMIATRAIMDALVNKGTLTREDADKTLADLGTKLGPPPTPAATDAAPTPGGITLGKSDYDVRKGLFYQASLVTRGADGGTQPQVYARLIYANPQGWWVGPIAYAGSNMITNNPSFVDHFTRYGVEASFTTGARRDVAGVARKSIELMAAYQWGQDGNVGGTDMKVRHSGGFAEGTYLFDDRNLAVLRWDRLTSGDLPGIEVNTITLNYTHFLQRNLKAGVEFVPDLMGNSANHAHGNLFSMFYDFTF